jgi:uncharacterized protein (TIGR02145 family)
VKNLIFNSMKTIVIYSKRTHWFKVSIAFLTCLLFLVFPSCQKDVLNQDPMLNSDNLSPSASSKKDNISYGKVKDIEGNVYKTVKIGKQWWMAENLAYLPVVSPPTEGSVTNPYYYVYGYNGTNVDEAKESEIYKTFGVLYNWTAAKTACPKGWHLPSYAEWEQLAQFISDKKGPYLLIPYKYWENVGKHLKSTSGWPDGCNGTDDFGFSALPGAFYDGLVGAFNNIPADYWWTTTRNPGEGNFPWYLGVCFAHPNLDIGQDCSEKFGFSVRCVKD